MRTYGKIVRCSTLSDHDVSAMFELLVGSFQNVSRDAFENDLREKDEVVLLYSGDRRSSAAHRLCGFSTIQFLQYRFSGQNHRVIFSGDTVIAPAYWGSLQLPVLWGRRMMELLDERPGVPLWWMLISKGIRTFKFLPVFFRSYFPNPAVPVPNEIRSLMETLGKLKFPSQFDRSEGVVRPSQSTYFLRPALAARKDGAQEKICHQFFYSRNPEYDRGSELFCLTQFSRENLHPFILRLIDERRLGSRRLLDAA